MTPLRLAGVAVLVFLVSLPLTRVIHGLPDHDGAALNEEEGDKDDPAQRLLANQPSLRVLYMSGHPSAETATRAVPLIQKPFSPFRLLGEVRRVLDR